MRRETFDTPGEVTLDLRVAQGRVDLETVPGGTTTEVELDARGNDDEVRELLEEARIESRARQGGYEVVVHVEDRRRMGLGVQVIQGMGNVPASAMLAIGRPVDGSHVSSRDCIAL